MFEFSSVETNEIAKAFISAQKAMDKVKKSTSNPYFRSKYADLTSVIEACKDVLNKNDIGLLQPTLINEQGETVVRTYLMHTSGQFFASDTKVIVAKEKDAQSNGSGISYARRYGLQSLICLPAEDDDGNSASNKKQSTVVDKSNKAAPFNNRTRKVVDEDDI